MNLPVFDHVSLQAVLLSAIWGIFCLYGLAAGVKKSSRLLAASLVALGIAVIPQINVVMADLISVIITRRTTQVAYLLVFVCLFIALRLLFYRLPMLVPLRSGSADRFLGLAAGFVTGFAHVTMALLLLLTVRFPVNGLYESSAIAGVIGRFWERLDLLHILYTPQYMNPTAWF